MSEINYEECARILGNKTGCPCNLVRETLNRGGSVQFDFEYGDRQFYRFGISTLLMLRYRGGLDHFLAGKAESVLGAIDHIRHNRLT